MKDETDFDDLLRRAEEAVDAAFDAEHRPDPILGTMSRMVSIAGALTKRHGSLIEGAVAISLAESGRYEVSEQLRFPITEAADRLVAANHADALQGLRLAFDAEARRTLDLDIAAVDVEGSRGLAVEIKRSVASLSGARRAALDRDMRSVRLLLRSFFRQQGVQVDDVDVAILDLQAPVSSGGLVVGRDGVDRFFGVPVLARVDALSERMRRRINHRAAELLGHPAKGRPQLASSLFAERLHLDDADDTPLAPVRSDWRRAFSRAGSTTGSTRHASQPEQPRPKLRRPSGR